MAKLESRCPQCKKNVELLKEERSDAFQVIFKTFSCGHSTTEQIVALKTANEGYKLVCATCLVNLSDPSIPSNEKSKHLEHDLHEIPLSRDLMFARAMNYQQAGIEFLENANFNALLNDEQGLGKTIQALLAVKHHKDKLTPTLFVVKSKLKLNWAQEMVMNGWLCDKDDLTDYPFIVMDGQMAILPGFKYYIVSMSMLEKAKKFILGYGFKCLIVDESQNFANTKSQRTKALLEIAKVVPHRICMSGTPILNRASDYWPSLNMTRPDHWLTFEGFLRQWVDYDLTPGGAKRYTGLKPGMRDWFFQKTKGYILRRNKRDVLKDLPPFRRTFEIVDISDSAYKGLYNKEAEGLDNYLNSAECAQAKQFERSSRILGYLMRMRHLTGVAKVPSLIEDIIEFMETAEDKTEKLIVGVHHDDVMEQLKIALDSYSPIILNSGLDDSETMARIEKFKLTTNRLCIAKILAAGEGLNLQFCTNMIVFERMWNAGKEGQFEARIDRPLKCPNDKLLLKRTGEVLFCQKCDHKEPVVAKTANYKIAKNTVDEIFTQMVEEKRKIAGETTERDFNFEADPVILNLLGEKAARLRI
jgi:SNF2 family DNA or RNA helicase